MQCAITSSHQFSVDVTGPQYPSPAGGYAIAGRALKMLHMICEMRLLDGVCCLKTAACCLKGDEATLVYEISSDLPFLP